MPEPIIYTELAEVILQANRLAYDMGYTAEELMAAIDFSNVFEMEDEMNEED